MDKTKKLIIALVISLVLVSVFNFIVISINNSKYTEVLIFKENKLKGSVITNQDVTVIKVKQDSFLNEMSFRIDKNYIQDKVLKKDVSKGDAVTKEKLVDKEQILESDEQYSYISIPITDLSYSTCSKLKQGDKVTLFYTAKSKDVANAIKNKQKIYSTTTTEGKVTCMLFEQVEVISVHDSTGKQTENSLITDVLIRVKKEDAMLIANLKSQGVFDIVLN